MKDTNRYQITKKATVVNSSINVVLALLKVILGVIGNSHALVADGIHSFSDLITDALVLFASKMGTQAPDKEHPYGHQRIETLAAIIISLILIGVAFSIGYDTLNHIIDTSQVVKPDFFVIIVAVVSIFGNEFLYHYTLKLGNQVDSDLLRSNAWHNRSDSFVSIIVLVSVIGSMLGAHYLDAIGALIIAILILKMAIKMIYRNIRELIDTGANEKLLKEITDFIKNSSGVTSIHQLRTRSHGGNIFLDVHIEVNPYISVSEGHFISEQVNIGLRQHFKSITDVTVHIDPEDDEQVILSQNLPTRELVEPELKQRWNNLKTGVNISIITLHYLSGKISADIYLPTSITNLENRIQQYQQAITDLTYLDKIRFYTQIGMNIAAR